MPAESSKYERLVSFVDHDKQMGREKPIDYPFVDPPKLYTNLEYEPNRDYMLKPLDKGHVEYARRTQKRFTNTEAKNPTNFHHVVSRTPVKTVSNYERLGSKRRTDSTLVQMKTTKPRDNSFFFITEAWNLDEKAVPQTYDSYLTERLKKSPPVTRNKN